MAEGVKRLTAESRVLITAVSTVTISVTETSGLEAFAITATAITGWTDVFNLNGRSHRFYIGHLI